MAYPALWLEPPLILCKIIRETFRWTNYCLVVAPMHDVLLCQWLTTNICGCNRSVTVTYLLETEMWRELQSKAHKQWVIENRFYLHRIIDAVLYLSRQGLPFRWDLWEWGFPKLWQFLGIDWSDMQSIDPNFHMQSAKMPDNAGLQTRVLKFRMNCWSGKPNSPTHLCRG